MALALSLTCHLFVLAIPFEKQNTSHPTLSVVLTHTARVDVAATAAAIEPTVAADPQRTEHQNETKKARAVVGASEPAHIKAPASSESDRALSGAETISLAYTGDPLTNSDLPKDTSAVPEDSATNAALILNEIRAQLRAHVRYPTMARRQGWEGIVRIAFRIERDGTIDGATLIESSGHRVLDLAALDAFSRLDTVSRPQGPLFLELPIVYRLTES